MGTQMTGSQMTAVSSTLRPAAGGPARSSRILLTAVILLSVLGLLLATWTVTGARDTTARIGDPVGTGFGTFTVTRVSKTFVPDTQGPPSAAQHAGTNGSDQLQVWVSLQNTADAGNGISLASSQFSLVSEAGGQKLRAAGSSLDKDLLAPGSSIDGQVWFDPKPGGPGRRWLVFTPSDGNTVRVALGSVGVSKAPAHH